MYDIIDGIINHVWSTTSQNSTEQQVLYYISGALIIVMFVVLTDLVYRIFSNFWKRA